MNKYTTTRTSPQFCPFCFQVIDAVSPAENAHIVPKPGDFTLCIYCAAILTFDADMMQLASSLLKRYLKTRVTHSL